jgi:serine/threonine protein kinase
MCALDRPFKMDNGDGFFELRERILENDYEPLPDKYSKEIKQLVKSMLEKDPLKRPNLN